MGDYFPRNDSELLAWLSSLSKGLATYGATLGFSDAEVKADQKICSDLVSLIQTDEQKRRDWLAAAEATKTFKQKELPTLRTTIARLKTAPGYSQGIGQILGVIGSASQAIVKEEVKPALRASSQGGKIELRFTRGRLSGINVYMRKKGESTWQSLGRAARSPFVDATPVTSATGSEVREYRAYGVLGDEEVGAPSDIVVVATGGK